ncbi:hypothetical protein ACX935_005317 [Klebsiella oxytoca]
MTTPSEEESENGNTTNGSGEFPYEEYFKSKEAFLIFVLLYVDKEKRANFLGIHEELYESKVKARKWRNSLIKLIHSDHCKHLSADEATAKINEIYARMKKNAK